MKCIIFVLLLITMAQFTNAEDKKMKNILIVTGSTKGSTAEIGYKMKEFLEERFYLADTISTVNSNVDVSKYDLIIIGSGIYGGKPHPNIPAFISKNRSELSHKNIAVFAVCAKMASPKESKRKEALVYADRVACKLPTISRVSFAGNIPGPNPQGWFQKTMAEYFIGIQNTGDFRDWDKIKRWTISLID